MVDFLTPEANKIRLSLVSFWKAFLPSFKNEDSYFFHSQWFLGYDFKNWIDNVLLITFLELVYDCKFVRSIINKVFKMKYRLCLIFLFLFSNAGVAQKVAIYDNYVTLEKAVLNDKSTTYIVNFWATWCGPCVKELPHFEKLNAENKNIKVVLVSLDFKNQYETKLLPFLKNKNIKSEVVLLTDKDYNSWLPIVSKEWGGSIPATLIIQNGTKKIFAERMFPTYEELTEFVNTNTN